MITIDGKEYRNLQEQVEKNKDDITRLQSGITIIKSIDFADISSVLTDENVGKYYLVKKDEKEYLYIITRRLNDGLLAKSLGEYPAVVKGAKGDKGDKGDTGVGHGIIGNGSSVPSNDFGTDGDYFIVNLTAHTYLYKKVDGVWTNQLDLKGVKGNDGCNVAVYANTADVASEYLNKLKVAGVQYALLGNNDTNFTGTTRLENIIVTGDSVFDDIAITEGGEISGDLIPSTSNVYNFGSSQYYWQNGYIGTLYVGNILASTIKENGILLSQKYQPKEKAMTLIETITLSEDVQQISRNWGDTHYKKLIIKLESLTSNSYDNFDLFTINEQITIGFGGSLANNKIACIIMDCTNDFLITMINNWQSNISSSTQLTNPMNTIVPKEYINRIRLSANNGLYKSGFKMTIYGVEE